MLLLINLFAVIVFLLGTGLEKRMCRWHLQERSHHTCATVYCASSVEKSKISLYLEVGVLAEGQDSVACWLLIIK